MEVLILYVRFWLPIRAPKLQHRQFANCLRSHLCASTVGHRLLDAMLTTGVVSAEAPIGAAASAEALPAGSKRCHLSLATVFASRSYAARGCRFGCGTFRCSHWGCRDGGLSVRNCFGLAIDTCGRHAFEASCQIGARNDDFVYHPRIGGIWSIAKVDSAAAIFPAVHL